MTAFRAAVASAPSLDVPVPTCLEWTLFDLVQHLGEGLRSRAATVAAGAAAPAKSAEGAPAAPRLRLGSARPCRPARSGPPARSGRCPRPGCLRLSGVRRFAQVAMGVRARSGL
ncbi:maleylpyruvate isomerase N-terminal domain-containing protein [Streptomyces europaeiscabiei]